MLRSKNKWTKKTKWPLFKDRPQFLLMHNATPPVYHDLILLSELNVWHFLTEQYVLEYDGRGRGFRALPWHLSMKHLSLNLST